MKLGQIITYFLIGLVFLLRSVIYIYLKKIKLINILIYLLFLIAELVKLYNEYEIIKILCVFAYIYFAYSVFITLDHLIYDHKRFGSKFTFNLKINYILFKAHYFVLHKQSKFKQFVILFFIAFKIKLLFDIFNLKYFGHISCIGILYAQSKFYPYIIKTYYDINVTLMVCKGFYVIKGRISRVYARFMLPAYIIFFISSLNYVLTIILKYLNRYY